MAWTMRKTTRTVVFFLGVGLDADGGERHHGAGYLSHTRVAQRELAPDEFFAGFEPGEAVAGVAGGNPAHAGVAEPDCDESLEREIVIGAVDEDRIDAAPGEEFLELGLGAPAPLPGDQPGTV
jgi:hypothetical protein